MKSPTTPGAGPAQISVTVKTGLKEKVIKAPAGTRLIDALQCHETMFLPACGGRGICKKCLVSVAGQGLVLACKFIIKHDIEVTIPVPAAGARILESDCGAVREVACDSGITMSSAER
jgi:Na+-transporting NADH:ubiquinone oxidoreductase subunit NqrF